MNGFEEIQNDLIDYAYDLKNNQPKGGSISNRGGWQSSCFLLNNENDTLQSFLMDCLGEFPPIKKSVDLIVSAWVISILQIHSIQSIVILIVTLQVSYG